MKISEYTLLQDAFEGSFGFMLNRLADLGLLKGDHFEWPLTTKELAEERCFTEFMNAIDEMGIELGDVESPLREKRD